MAFTFHFCLHRANKRKGRKVHNAVVCPLGCGSILGDGRLEKHFLSSIHKMKVRYRWIISSIEYVLMRYIKILLIAIHLMLSFINKSFMKVQNFERQKKTLCKMHSIVSLHLFTFINQVMLIMMHQSPAGNMQKWKSTFLTCPWYKMYRVETVGLKVPIIIYKLRFYWISEIWGNFEKIWYFANI